MSLTTIEWTTYSFNPWWGCHRVSPGCRGCYADSWAKRWGMDLWHRSGPRRMMSDAHWREPLKWNRGAEAAGQVESVFCASMADVFEQHPVPDINAQLDAARARLWALIDATPWLVWLLLTKRPDNPATMVPWGEQWPANVWLGTSVEDQQRATERIPALLASDAQRTFLSCEPLLEPPDLTRVAYTDGGGTHLDVLNGWHGVPDLWQAPARRVDWVIVGGESGADARPMHPDWARTIRDQCQTAGVPFLFKQWGEWGPAPWRVDPEPGEPVADYKARAEAVCATHAYQPWAHRYGHHLYKPPHKPWSVERTELPDGAVGMRRWGKHAAGRLLDGRVHDDQPALTQL